MNNTFSKIIATRYLTAKKQNQWVSFITLISILGLILGVAALITVLSVMNGFDRELKNRLLSTISHATLVSSQGQAIQDWPAISQQLLAKDTDIVAAAPMITRKVMLVNGGLSRAVNLNAIDVDAEQQVSSIMNVMLQGDFNHLTQSYALVLGSVAADQLGVEVGQKVNVVLPQLMTTALGVFPRTKRFEVVGIFEAGAQVDGTEVFISLDDGRKLFRYQDADVQGLRLRLQDMFSADAVAARHHGEFKISTWYESNASLFAAIAMEKIMMTFLLLIVVAVASFNVVSIMSMMVNDKRTDIAVMRVMGASKATIQGIFIATGLLIGMLGSLIGTLIGVLLAKNIGAIVGWVENAVGVVMFDPTVYYISQLPSHLMWQDVVLVLVVSLLLSLLSSYYPAKRAAAIHPSQALQYE
jgi:lipoprotein-releasing system permease protein